jgi:cell division septation protein DedD
MKRMDPRGKSSVFYIGKGVIILGIVTTCSLGFLLGFFVGKNTQPPVVRQAPVVMPPASPPSAALQNTDPLKQEATSQRAQQQDNTTKSDQPGIQAPQSKSESPQADNMQTGVKSGQVQEQGKGSAVQGDAGAKKYTVQAGAFKNASEANTLKTKLNEKGYKAYVATVETKEHNALYKVLVGKFARKSEAVLSAVGISKNEGVHAFVTVRKQEELRSQ